MSYRDDFDEKEVDLPDEVLDEVLGDDGDDDGDEKMSGLLEEDEKEWE